MSAQNVPQRLPTRGRYTLLNADKLDNIYHTLVNDSEMTSMKLATMYHLKGRTARQLLADFAASNSRADFHITERRGRHRKNFALLHNKIESILKRDNCLTIRGV
eukprot:EG_transcript_20694